VVCAFGDSVLGGGSVQTVKGNRETVEVASKEIGLDLNVVQGHV
jgi:hypothetical protein